MSRLKSTHETLLAGFRAGKFQALLCLADYWQETPGYERHAKAWDQLAGVMGYTVSPRYSRKMRRALTRIENTRRAFLNFCFRVERADGKGPSRCGGIVYGRTGLYRREWVSEMAGHLYDYFRQKQVAAEEDTTDVLP